MNILNQKHTQEECIGFIDGFSKALEIAERIKYEFAIEILESKPNWDMWTIAKLTELKNKIQ